MPIVNTRRRLPWVSAMLLLGCPAALAQQPPPRVDDFFDDGIVHEIRLTLNPRDWNELKANFQRNDYYPAHFTWRGLTVLNIGIRSRGVGSRSGTKPGLRVDFDHYEQRQRFLGLKSVVLRNNTQDPSHLHDRLSMKLYARLGMPASRVAHVRLLINGEYAGLYTIVESVDKIFLEKHYGESGGYLYKYHYDADDPARYFDYLGPDPALYSPEPFQPETHELDPDPRPLAALMRAIQESTDAEFQAVVGRYVDLRQFMVHVAVETFLADTDGMLGDWGANNFYFYRLQGQTRSLFIPWDKSEAFKGGVEHSIWRNLYDVPSWLRNRLMSRAEELIDLRDVYLDTLLACADVVLTEASVDDSLAGAHGRAGVEAMGWLESEIRREYEQIRAAVLEDPVKPFSNEWFEASVGDLLTFARSRSAFVRQDVARSRR